MKLLLCLSCDDVVKLRRYFRTCDCRKSGGKYLEDGHAAEYGGPARLIGVANPDVVHALRREEHPSIRAWMMSPEGARWKHVGDLSESPR